MHENIETIYESISYKYMIIYQRCTYSAIIQWHPFPDDARKHHAQILV